MKKQKISNRIKMLHITGSFGSALLLVAAASISIFILSSFVLMIVTIGLNDDINSHVKDFFSSSEKISFLLY